MLVCHICRVRMIRMACDSLLQPRLTMFCSYMNHFNLLAQFRSALLENMSQTEYLTFSWLIISADTHTCSASVLFKEVDLLPQTEYMEVDSVIATIVQMYQYAFNSLPYTLSHLPRSTLPSTSPWWRWSLLPGQKTLWWRGLLPS